jgi:hypothetical protein
MSLFVVRRRSARRRSVSRTRVEPLESRRLLAGLLHINDGSITEGDAGVQNLTFVIDLDGGAGTALVTASTSDGSASAAEGDYTPTSQPFVFTDSRKSP